METRVVCFDISIVLEIQAKSIVDGPPMGHTSIKMANMSQDYLVGDDLDDLFLLLEGGFLDEDADLNREVDEVAADEENAEGYKCNSCDKNM